MTIDEISNETVRICKDHNADEVILYGSRAKGCALERSDIDIAVRGAERFPELEEEIEEIPTLYSIDVVNLDKTADKLFLEDIADYGRTIYKKI